MELSVDLEHRGLIKDRTFSKLSWLNRPRKFYFGIDASADSLTVGNLALILLARRLTNAGWQAVVLLGGGTSLVGDPGGKSKERELLPRESVASNVEKLKTQIDQLFAGQDFELVDNYEWLSKLGYLEALRDVGKHFTMNELMQREFVTERLSSGISYAEFSYSLIQGYDYWHLYKTRGTELQIGGSDQWGNMLSGASLVRKKEGKEVQALSMPLITNKNSGVKFGKSEAGAIWLDSSKTSPTQFFQFWVNTDDSDVEDYLRVFTFIPLPEIAKLMEEHKRDPGARLAQRTLAQAVTTIVHGDDSNTSASTIAAYLNGNRPLASATPDELEEIRRQIPVINSKAGESIIKLLVSSGLAVSNSEARRLLNSRAIYLNHKTLDHELLAAADFEGGLALLRRGKAYKDSALIIHG